MKRRLLAWMIQHDSHGISFDTLCFLPEGEVPETMKEWRRMPWLDQELIEGHHGIPLPCGKAVSGGGFCAHARPCPHHSRFVMTPRDIATGCVADLLADLKTCGLRNAW